MNPNKALWEKGDFTRIAESMRESGEALVGATRNHQRTQGTGSRMRRWNDGIAGSASSERTCLGVDIARNLVEAGNRRAKEQGLTNCKFQEGDASNLHELKDNTFDLVVSIFGAMFAPKPFDVAKEMVRVTRPGGRIVMGNWIPNDPTLVAQILKISSAYSPPPPEGFISPMTWGIENNVIEDLRARGLPRENISFVRDTYTFKFSESAVRACRRVQKILWADDECVRSGGKEWPRRRSAEGAGSSVRQPEQKPAQGCHVHSRDLLARYSRAELSL